MFNQFVHPIVPLLQLLDLLGRVDGRKKIQKIVHILQERGVSFPERFQYAYYGMYSQQLRSEIERLESENLVKESPIQGMNVSYSLEKTLELDALMGAIQQQKPIWADLARELNSLPAQELEGISTILFLKRSCSGGVLKQRVLGLKPHLAPIYDRCEAKASTLPDFSSREVKS